MTGTACFLTTDSVNEGVGRSQIVSVLREVAARGWTVKLVSFEKERSTRNSIPTRLTEYGIEHTELPFGSGGLVPGAGRLARLFGSIPEADVYHCRSDIPFLAAYMRRRSPVIWDCRSFWVEQRAAAGLISRSSPAYRLLRRVEGLASRSADGLITLSHRAAGALESQWGRLPPYRAVIPTVTDLQHFTPTPLPPLDVIRACLSGSFGPNYDPVLAQRFLGALAGVLAPGSSVETVWTSGSLRPATGLLAPNLTCMTTDYSDLPAVIASTHFGLVPISLGSGLSAAAMMPTKVGEFWASGRPIVVTRGVGDLDEIVRRHRVGVTLESTEEEELTAKAADLVCLLLDPESTYRCRSVAEEYFDLQKGVTDLTVLYESVLNTRPC